MAKKKKDDEEEAKPTKKSAVVAGSGYEVLVGEEWEPCAKGTENAGWLYYALPDGNTGYAKPESWRKQKK